MAQPAVNDVLTWDGTRGVYSPNPANSLALDDTYIFVGNSINIATGVPLTLADAPGAFSLSNTGILTMPDASASGRGLLNATSWGTVGFLHNDGSGNLEWQVVSSSQTLAATLAIGNNVGGLAITATDGTASLNLTTGSAIIYSNISSASAPLLTLDQATALARMSSVHGVVDFDATAMNLTHVALINFSAPQYNITNIATDSYLYVDASGFIVAGTTPIVAVPTLYEVLTAGPSMGGLSITSPDSLSTLDITNSILQLNWTNSTSQGQLYFNALNLGLAWSDGTESAAFNANAADGELVHSQDLTVNAPIVRIGTRTDNTSIIYGYNSTTHTFVSATASTVPYFDASKNLVSSSITPTELGNLSGSTSPLQAQIDALVSGLSWKQAVRVRTTADITLSGPQTIDGVSVIAGDRVLVMNQTLQTENGIYVCAAGAWTRSTDADTGAELLQATVATQEGTLYADQQYVCTTNAPIVIGVSNIVFVLVGGTTYVGTTNRISVTGNVIDIDAAYVGQASITTLGTITTGTWNATAINYAYIASMSSANLAGIITDETGYSSGALLVFSKSPTIEAPTVSGIATFSGVINESQGANIASAGTTDIGAATGNYVNVTGTTTITSLGTIQAGTRRIVNFTGALTLTYNASSLILPGGASIITEAGDVAEFISLGSGNWVCSSYQKVNGSIVGHQVDMMVGALAVFSPSDSSTTYIGMSTPLAPSGTATLRQFQLPTGMIVGAMIYVDPTSTIGSSESVTYYLRNITDGTSTLLGTLTYDARGNQLFYPVSIAVSSSKIYSVEIVNPVFGTNPTNCYTLCKLTWQKSN